MSHDKQWNEKVARGRALVTEINDRKWELGDLANEVCPAGANGVNNDGVLDKFAAEIGISSQSLRTYRFVASQWPAVSRDTAQTFTTHRILAAREDRFEIIAEQIWTYNSLTERLGRLPNPSRKSDAEQRPYLDPRITIAEATPEQKRDIFIALSSDADVSDDKQTRREAEKNLDAAFSRSDFGMKSARAQEQEDAQRKSATDLRFIGATAGLAVAKRKIREALAEVKGSAINEEHAALLGSDLDDLVGLVDLFRSFLVGDDQDVDWDAELAALMGGDA